MFFLTGIRPLLEVRLRASRYGGTDFAHVARPDEARSIAVGEVWRRGRDSNPWSP
jgi:hypothetical protein